MCLIHHEGRVAVAMTSMCKRVGKPENITNLFHPSLISGQLAQPARLLLEYTGTKYEDKFYVCGEGNLPVQPTAVVIVNKEMAQVFVQQAHFNHLTHISLKQLQTMIRAAGLMKNPNFKWTFQMWVSLTWTCSCEY